VIRFAVLGSGSSGNSAVVECGDTRLLVDCGLSARQISLRLDGLGINPASLDGILLTHEHGDHIGGLRVFVGKYRIPVIATRHTARVVGESGIDGCHWKHFNSGDTFRIKDAEIRSFSVHHDAVDPVGFVIGSPSGRKLGLLSDAGHVTHSMSDSLRGLDALFVEANYDDQLLEADSKRPWSIKQRISSRHGHLSNAQVTELICDIAHAGLSRVVLGHLSSDCNQPDLVLSNLGNALSAIGHTHIGLRCATQHEASPWFDV
jgi:phosphoribosyl 1,2-cyclic phosphodiesterase